MDPRVGRFTGMDPFEGLLHDPASLHKYVYAAADPGNKVDPTGRFASVAEINIGLALINVIAANQVSLGFDVITEVAFRDNAVVQVGKAATLSGSQAPPSGFLRSG